jgi:hypothetical protein
MTRHVIRLRPASSRGFDQPIQGCGRDLALCNDGPKLLKPLVGNHDHDRWQFGGTNEGPYAPIDPAGAFGRCDPNLSLGSDSATGALNQVRAPRPRGTALAGGAGEAAGRMKHSSSYGLRSKRSCVLPRQHASKHARSARSESRAPRDRHCPIGSIAPASAWPSAPRR